MLELNSKMEALIQYSILLEVINMSIIRYSDIPNFFIAELKVVNIRFENCKYAMQSACAFF